MVQRERVDRALNIAWVSCICQSQESNSAFLPAETCICVCVRTLGSMGRGSDTCALEGFLDVVAEVGPTQWQRLFHIFAVLYRRP